MSEDENNVDRKNFVCQICTAPAEFDSPGDLCNYHWHSWWNGHIEIPPRNLIIDSFSGDFRFLSNFYESPINFGGLHYPTAEHFYQAMKTFSVPERKKIACLDTPKQAKREGRKLDIRVDWESSKLDVMREVLRLKFEKGTQLAEMLEATYPAKLIEGNFWGDYFWGVDNKTGQGKNWLGRLLMERRAELLKTNPRGNNNESTVTKHRR